MTKVARLVIYTDSLFHHLRIIVAQVASLLHHRCFIVPQCTILGGINICRISNRLCLSVCNICSHALKWGCYENSEQRELRFRLRSLKSDEREFDLRSLVVQSKKWIFDSLDNIDILLTRCCMFFLLLIIVCIIITVM